jgi:hypothetical protein
MSFFLLAACAVACRCEAAPPEDPVGTWKLKCVSPDGKHRECVVTISRDGKTLNGICTSDGVKRPIKEIVFDQGVLSVRVDGEFVGQVYGLTYKGKPVGDIYRGTVHWSYGWASGRFAFNGERIGQKVAVIP